MRFERVTDFDGHRLPIGLVVDFGGGDERVGRRDQTGDFSPVTSVQNLPKETVSPFGPGLALIVPCTVTFKDVSGADVAEMDVAIASDRLACVAVRALPGAALTGKFLREIPIAKLVEDAGRAATVRVLRTPRGALFGARFPTGGPGFGDAAKAVTAVQGKRRQRLAPDFLREVARIYREAQARGQPPSKAVADAFAPVAAPESARRWVQRARQAGFLGRAAGHGRRGEAEEISEHATSDRGGP